MRVDKLSIERIFERAERLEAPLFQRPYVWEEERNWEPLWESIRDLAERRLKGSNKHPHFLGTIVLDQLRNPTGRMAARQIIDGQQRLTTLQLAMQAACDLCTRLGETNYAESFQRLTKNQLPPRGSEEHDRFKVWPTNADRADFQQVMTAGTPEAVRKLPHADRADAYLIPDAYLYFSDRFSEFIGARGTPEFEIRLGALYSSIREDLHLVVIDLDQGDDAQEIFETLNALGTPLLPADLVKNLLFHTAHAQGEDSESLYAEYWRQFDDEKSYWRKETRQGRMKRPRIDIFLNHYLTLMTGQDVLLPNLFSTFRQLLTKSENPSARHHMRQFREYASVYQTFESSASGSRAETFFHRLDALDTTTVFPYLLGAFHQFGDKPIDEALVDIESFLVRRLVCEMGTRAYSRLFAEAVSVCRSNNDFSPNSLRSFLLRQTLDDHRWPTDEEFRAAWMSIPFYRRIKQKRVKMILLAIEVGLHSRMTEKLEYSDDMQIEHILPREWERHWPVEAIDEKARTQAERMRNEAVHKIGNLTLLRQPLNATVSNGPWLRKQQKIMEHSALNLNRPLQKHETWNENAIDQRSADLFAVALQIWPRP